MHFTRIKLKMYTEDVNVDVITIASKMPLYDCLSNTDIIIHIQQTEARHCRRSSPAGTVN